MAVRAIRGATHLRSDDPAEMREAVVELVTSMLSENSLDSDSLISILFTATPDLVSEFPAAAARTLGLGDVPLMCAQEIAVAGSMPRVIRILAHVESPAARSDIVHQYLRGAQTLRADLAT